MSSTSCPQSANFGCDLPFFLVLLWVRNLNMRASRRWARHLPQGWWPAGHWFGHAQLIGGWAGRVGPVHRCCTSHPHRCILPLAMSPQSWKPIRRLAISTTGSERVAVYRISPPLPELTTVKNNLPMFPEFFAELSMLSSRHCRFSALQLEKKSTSLNNLPKF